MEMNLLQCLGIVLIALTVHAIPELRKFEGYKVYRLNVKSQKQLDVLKKLHLETDLDFWTEPRRHGFTDVMANDEQFKTLFNAINATKIPSSILINDVQSLIAEQKQSETRAEDTKVDWESYHRYTAITSWMEELIASYPNLTSVRTIGKSYENRDIKAIKISTGGSGKKAILIDGCHHAREWISVACTTYIINELATNSNEYKSILDTYDIHIIPVINPDGYEYTFTDDRLWRRTRSENGDSKCRGVDPNRNYDFHYGEEGTSDDPCSEIYKGPKAFSEPETRALRDYLIELKEKNSGTGYFTLHSYGTYWLTPWGYTSQLPTDYKELVRVANTGAEEIYKHYGTKYKVGTSTNVLYAAAGGSDDYAKGVQGFKYSYTLELRDKGKHGFVLPPSQIGPTCFETWNGLQAAIKAI